MQFHSLRTCIKAVFASAAVCLSLAGAASAADIPSGKSGFVASSQGDQDRVGRTD